MQCSLPVVSILSSNDGASHTRDVLTNYSFAPSMSEAHQSSDFAMKEKEP